MFLLKPLNNAFLLFFCLSIGTAEARLSSHEITQSDSFQAQLLYDALVAEIYIQFGDEKSAVDH